MVLRQLHRLTRWIEVGQEVKNALETKKPVVALESTIITHGMPHPYNVETALAVETIVREEHAIPATIAIIGGKLKIGLTPQEIHFLASSKNVVKTSRRDIPFVLSKGMNGGTTVAGTMLAANSVGIQIFVTGGIGGVHRCGEQTMDISADLTELGKTPIAVVCSGIKSILDIGRSLEFLETQGVCVVSYSPTRDFPAFYCHSSQFKSPYNVTSPEEAAALVQTVHDLQLQSGLVFAVPIPKEHQVVDENTMESAIQKALQLADEKNISGKEITPFILNELAELTEGRSLQSNIALIKNNARVGARIAVALSKRTVEPKAVKSMPEINGPGALYATTRSDNLHPVVVGGSIVDSVVSVKEPFKVEGVTLRGHIRQFGGGVGRNLADALGKLGLNPTLVSAVGDDPYGRFLLHSTLNHLEHSGVLVTSELPTASYTVVLDNRGNFRLGVGDMDVHALITPDHISKHLRDTSAVIMDGNAPAVSIAFVLEHCSKYGIPVMFEPTDVAKAAIPFQFETWKCLRLISPNIKELRKIASFLGLDVGTCDESSSTIVEDAVSMAMPIAEHIQTVMVTLGALGLVMVGRQRPSEPVTARYYASNPLDSVLSVSGAGDCLAAAVIKGMLSGLEEPQCVAAGLAAAYDSLQHLSAVPSEFTSPPPPVEYCLVDTAVKRTLPSSDALIK